MIGRQCYSTYMWHLNGGLRYYARPTLRQPGPGEPDVPDLVHPGDWFMCSYTPDVSQGVVVSVCPTRDVIAGMNVVYYTVAYIPIDLVRIPRRPADQRYLRWANDVVAHHGTLCKLFAASRDTFTVVNPPPIPREEWAPWVKEEVNRAIEQTAQLRHPL